MYATEKGACVKARLVATPRIHGSIGSDWIVFWLAASTLNSYLNRTVKFRRYAHARVDVSETNHKLASLYYRRFDTYWLTAMYLDGIPTRLISVGRWNYTSTTTVLSSVLWNHASMIRPTAVRLSCWITKEYTISEVLNQPKDVHRMTRHLAKICLVIALNHATSIRTYVRLLFHISRLGVVSHMTHAKTITGLGSI
jgi:hypothetical protein